MYSNLRLFKEGIKPLWEESANKEGGKWVLVFPVDFASEDDVLFLFSSFRFFLELLVFFSPFLSLLTLRPSPINTFACF